MIADKRTVNVLKLMNKLGADFEIPEEIKSETSVEELVCDWDGGVLNETK